MGPIVPTCQKFGRLVLHAACCTVPATVTLPGFTEGPNFHIERPGRTRLVSDMPDFGGNIVRLYEEGIWPVRPALARPGNIDDSIDREVGGVHALRAKVPGDGFEQDTLCRFGGGKSGKAGLAAPGRCVPG